ncbi:MAG TPA: agglutinin biogenesis protein MshP [Burkholderiales bacterium]|jgi:MSHA biogenesis protein MshP|nr:agglutinin biogenesis protein MshP [Burkholderiales bacterium]
MAVVVALLAVLAVFGAALVMISTTQQVGAALDMQGVRAYYAARGGLEWGMYHVLRSGFGGCGGIDGKSLAYGANLADFRVTLACTSSTHEEADAPLATFSIVATACNDPVCPTASTPPPATYVERQLRVTVGGN